MEQCQRSITLNQLWLLKLLSTYALSMARHASRNSNCSVVMASAGSINQCIPRIAESAQPVVKLSICRKERIAAARPAEHLGPELEWLPDAAHLQISRLVRFQPEARHSRRSHHGENQAFHLQLTCFWVYVFHSFSKSAPLAQAEFRRHRMCKGTSFEAFRRETNREARYCGCTIYRYCFTVLFHCRRRPTRRCQLCCPGQLAVEGLY